VSLNNAMANARREIDDLYARWAELEAMLDDPAALHKS
jgi:hypothetical protein